MFWKAYMEVADQIELVDESKALRVELLDSSFEEGQETPENLKEILTEKYGQ